MEFLDKRDNRDIIEKIRRRRTVKGFACAFLTLGMAIFFILYGFRYFAERLNTVSAVILCVLCLALPFFLLGLPKELLDRSWEGKIISMKSHLVPHGRPSGGVAKIEEWIVLTVQTSSRIESVDADIKTVDRPARELSRFRVGDRLRHIAGTRYYQSLRRGSSTRDCVICGCLIRETGNTCPHCHYSIVEYPAPPNFTEPESVTSRRIL